MTAPFPNCNPRLRIPRGQNVDGLGRALLRTLGGRRPRIFKGADSRGKISSPHSVGIPAVVIGALCSCPLWGVLTSWPADLPVRQSLMPEFDLTKERELSFATFFPNYKGYEVALFPDDPLETLLGAHCRFCGHAIFDRNGLEHGMLEALFDVAAEVACPIVLILGSRIIFQAVSSADQLYRKIFEETYSSIAQIMPLRIKRLT